MPAKNHTIVDNANTLRSLHCTVKWVISGVTSTDVLALLRKFCQGVRLSVKLSYFWQVARIGFSLRWNCGYRAHSRPRYWSGLGDGGSLRGGGGGLGVGGGLRGVRTQGLSSSVRFHI